MMTGLPVPRNAPGGFDWLVRLSGWKLEEGRLVASVATAGGASATVVFSAAADSVWRYTVVPPGARLPLPSRLIEAWNGEPLPLSVREDGQGILVTGGKLMLRITREPWRVAFLDGGGRELCGQNPGDVDGFGRPFTLPSGYFRGEDGGPRVTEALRLHPDEHLYGLGEKFTPLDKAGQRIVSWTVDALGSTSELSHKNIPFLWSTRGYGLLLDCTARITWELGTVSCQTYAISAEADVLDAYVLYGPSPEEILRRYAGLTGRAPVPPRWTFGLWVSSGGTYRDRKAMEKLVAGLEEHDIPADVVHVDPWWMRWRRYCDYRWDEESFPDPQGFIDGLHRKGLKLCLWEHPYISVESELFRQGAERGYFVLKPGGREPYVIDYGLSIAPRPDGAVREAAGGDSWNARVAVIDLTNAGACRWFKDLHRPLLRMGVDVFKTDFGEDVPGDAVFSNGESGRTMHNLYPLLYNEAVFAVTAEEKGKGIVWGRSGTAGSQRYPVCWSGDPAADFASLASTIRGGLSAGLSGIPFWSNDIGAYRGKPDPELYVRWAQFGLFCSHSRMHGDSPREPWQFGDAACRIVRQFIKLRYALFPYLYSTAHEAAGGMPVLRALPLVFPDDENAHGKELEFMVGPWLLAAPVYERGERGKDDGYHCMRRVYLPAGTWYDYWEGTKIEGPVSLQMDVPLERTPLFIRGGAIVPMMGPASRIPEERIDPLIIDLYPEGESRYILREDEGTTEFRCEEDGKTTTVEWDAEKGRRIEVRVRGRQKQLKMENGKSRIVN